MSSPQSQSRPSRPRATVGEEQEDGEQPEEAKGGYSHDVTVAAITSMCAYVSELYGKDYELSHPPPGGWAAFNRDNLRKLQDNGKYNNGLTDRALDLMRHIPYFRSEVPELMYSTYPADHCERFCNPELRSPETDVEKDRAQERKEVSEETYEDHLPPHLMVLTTGHPWRCYTILIDTELGAVRFWDRYDGSEFPTSVPGDLGYEEDAEDVDEDGPDSWRAAPRYRISTFFDLWRKEFLLISN
ncbi:hypothetical protein PG991_011934 [Apiospora marii]|uniref:Knr4/Smi1-like domain-containing protein n=1 Tax=Apiospora marii TaxID=335849 RepID=A0ABR1RFK9_9PEZI